MRIRRLHLENFRVHRDSTLDIGDRSLVMIRGSNFAGKSTIGQALSMCLTPTTTGLDPQGRDFASKIKRGASTAVIMADIQTKRFLIQRTVTLHASITGRTRKSVCLSDPDWKPTPFDKKLEEQEAALTVALNTDAFLRMDEKRQKNLLAGLALPARYDFDRQIVEAVQEIFGRDAPNFDGEPFVAINTAYKKLFDERQVVNRQVKEFNIPEPIAVPAGINSQSLQEQMSRLRVERRSREQERDQAVLAAGKIEAERERIKAKRATLLTDEKLADKRAVAARKAEYDRLVGEKKQVETALDARLAQLGRYEDIPEDTATCPTCEQSVDLERLKEMAAHATVAMKEARDRNFALHQQIKDLGDVEGAIKAVRDHEAMLAELEATKMPDPTLFSFQPYNESLAEIDAAMEKLNAQLRPVIAAEERGKEIAIKQEQLRRLKEKAALLDTLVKYFDKDGIKAKLLAEYIGGFERKLNEVMSAWGYRAALSIEPYQFDVTNNREDTNPVRELSGAERVMFSWAFQCAVSWAANLGIVVIDEVAMFLPEMQPMLYDRLAEMIDQGYLEQAILLVADRSREVVTDVPGAAYFMVEDGAVHELRSQLVA